MSKRFPRRRSWGELLRRPFRRDWVAALRDVTLEIPSGQVFGLLGPNGAGKTTLFKILATLVLPDDGRAVVLGHDVRERPARVREALTPVIADERSLFWRLSAEENLRLFAGLYGLRGQTARDRVAEVFDVVGLKEAGDKLAGAFSSGMKQRLLIGRALLSRPRVLLLDEPTRSLDPILARDFRRFLRNDVAQRLGCTVLLATHSADEALDLCDRVGVLHRGQLLAVGTVEELKSRFRGGHYFLLAGSETADVLEALGRSGRVASVPSSATHEPGWDGYELQIPGGPTEAAELLAALVSRGARVARFERVDPSLADLLETIVADADDA